MRGAVAVVVTLAVVLAGCTTGGTGIGSETPDTTAEPVTAYEAYAFDHAGHSRPAIRGGITYPAPADELTDRFYATLLTTPEATTRFNRSILDADARAFVNTTDFEASVLVVIQAFPASSHPDYRVERVVRAGKTLRVWINDSSRAATADITVETVLLRVPLDGRAPPSTVTVRTETGVTFRSSAGVVTRSPRSDRTEASTPVELPYTAANDSANLEAPLDIRLRNEANVTNGYRIKVTACPQGSPPCGDTEAVTVLTRIGKLRAGRTLTIEDVVAKRGTYTVRIEAEVLAANGSRVTVSETAAWRVAPGAGDAVITIADGTVAFEQAGD